MQHDLLDGVKVSGVDEWVDADVKKSENHYNNRRRRHPLKRIINIHDEVVEISGCPENDV